MSNKRRRQPSRKGTPTYDAWCSVARKQGYRDRTTAKRAARTFHPSEHMSAYRCGDHFHIGHTAVDVIDGTATRAEVYGTGVVLDEHDETIAVVR